MVLAALVAPGGSEAHAGKKASDHVVFVAFFVECVEGFPCDDELDFDGGQALGELDLKIGVFAELFLVIQQRFFEGELRAKGLASFDVGGREKLLDLLACESDVVVGKAVLLQISTLPLA